MTTSAQGSGSLDNLHLAPLRTLSDFLLESARFQLPNFQDWEKWGNRVVNNLLYYQTNYFLMSAAVFLLVGLIHPMKVLLGLSIIGVLVYVFVRFFAQDARRSVGADPNQQPNKWTVLGGTIVGSYLVLYLFDSVLIVAFAILLPFSLTFVHASLRLRNIKNKITNAVEIVGVKQSPMGQFLEAMGLMPTAF
ncbi:PRA1 family protein 3 [Anopheles maculipalpis]|uniref:PRA1 family protein 3 n=1 Tax=Anopheles maculipalpis TaxID=1496333 RepID=UPI0021592D9B|nr:PRA1 family protein 3 [Anopheles maculipalpis]